MGREASLFWIVILAPLLALLTSCSDDTVAFGDNRVPECRVVHPLDGSVFAQGDTIEVAVVVSDGDGTVRSVRFDIDGTPEFEDTGEPFVMRWTTWDQDLGSHTVSATARDDDDATATDSVQIELVYQCRAPENTGDGWETACLEDVGMDPGPFVALLDTLGGHENHRVHGIVIVRHGTLVFEAYFEGLTHPTWGETPVTFDRERLHVSSSVTKSFTSALLGIAIERGMIPGLNAKVLDYYPEMTDLNTGLRRMISMEHMVIMKSGLEWDEWSTPLDDPANDLFQFVNTALNTDDDLVRFVLDRNMAATPGQTFCYNGGNPNVVGDVIRRASGLRLDAFAEEYLFEPLGIEESWWWLIRPDFVYASGDLALRPRDMAKFGQLFLQNGNWNGQQIVSEVWVRRSATRQTVFILTPTNHYTGYGMGWLTVSSEYGWGAFASGGWGGQEIFVMPEYDMVAVFTGGSYWDDQLLTPHQMMVGYVLPSITSAVDVK